MKFKINFNQ